MGELGGTARRTGRELLRALLDVVVPPHCPACGDQAAVPGCCRACRAHLLPRRPPWCRRCGEPVLGEGAPCPADHRPLQGIAFLRAPFAYAGTGGALVRRCKLDGDTAAGALLAAAIARAAADALRGSWRHAVVVPVPLHRRRRRTRGFDQAAWLAREIAKRLGFRAAAGVLVRTRETLPQGDPRVTSRDRNVEGAFAVGRPRAVTGRSVLLVDDVFTSGATARACATALRAAGAAEVALLAGCRS